MPELEGVLKEATQSEEVVSFTDLTQPGGSSLDFTKENNGTVELLFTAWGTREDTARDLATALGTSTFRGNDRVLPPELQDRADPSLS
jgi:hypothetical protein